MVTTSDNARAKNRLYDLRAKRRAAGCCPDCGQPGWLCSACSKRRAERRRRNNPTGRNGWAHEDRPTVEEIAAACAEIQAGWSEEERAMRAGALA